LATSHTGVPPVQEVELAVVHCTQMPVVVLQAGVLPLHCESLVQPATQVLVFGSQVGWPLGQSVEAKHSTQAPDVVLQIGSGLLHSLFAMQGTQVSVEASQIGVVPVQDAHAAPQAVFWLQAPQPFVPQSTGSLARLVSVVPAPP
jgi:hypothetical protein